MRQRTDPPGNGKEARTVPIPLLDRAQAGDLVRRGAGRSEEMTVVTRISYTARPLPSRSSIA